jgi:hypothetical protein
MGHHRIICNRCLHPCPNGKGIPRVRNLILFQFCLPCQRDHADDCERIMQKVAAPVRPAKRIPEFLVRAFVGAPATSPTSQFTKKEEKSGASRPRPVATAMALLIAMLAPATIRAQTPDPQSIQKVFYRPQDCRQTNRPQKNVVIAKGTATACSQVLVYFAAITHEKPAALLEVVSRPTFVSPQHPDAPGMCFRFQRDQCKPMERDVRFVCKNVWWTEGRCAGSSQEAK